MKVLHIEMGRHLYGGARQVGYLIDGLKSQGVENLLLTPKTSAIAEEVREHGSPVIQIDYRGDLDFRLAFKVKKLVTKLGIDLVHVHSRRGADVWGGLGAKWAKVPAILSRRVDNPESPKSIRYKYGLYAQTVCISEGIKKVLIENGLASDRVTAVRSAFVAKESQNPLERSKFLQRFSLPEDAIVVGTVAQLIPRKGHKLLLACLTELISKHPNMRVLFFGEGPERASLQQRIEELGLANRVQLVGFHSDLNNLIGNLDILAHPAYMEGLGVSLIQASAASVPIIASNAGGMPEIVRNDENGILVPPGDTAALQKALDRLAQDPELRARFGETGRNIAEKEFSVDVMVQGNLEVYRSILGQ